MTELLPFLVAGLTTGAVYGLAGVGLVLTFKTSGVFNFAHGALATIAAYGFYTLHVTHGMPWQLAAAIIILVVGPVMGVGMELLGRRIQGSGLALQVAATVGVLLVIEAAAQLIYGSSTLRTVPTFLGSGSFTLAGTNVKWASAITLAFAVVATVLLSLYFRFARRGLAMRAVVDDPELLDIAGTSPAATRRIAWIIGCSFVSACGVLFAPLLPLDPSNLTFLVLAAFGAAAIGAFTKLSLTFVGGLGIGVLASLSTKWFTSGIFAGIPSALPFIALFIVILIYPRRYLAGPTFFTPRVRSSWRAPAAFQVTAGLAVLVFLIAVPSFAGFHLTDWTIAVATTLVFLSLALLVRTSGQVSLCHISFMAIGAATFAHIANYHGIPWLVALALAGLCAVPVGALLAIPASRLSGLYLALATLGFGFLLQVMFYSEPYLFGTNLLGLQEPRPHLSWLNLDSDRGYYYLTLALVVIITAAVTALSRGRLGRLLQAMADSPTALETSGAAADVSRVIVFCLSAFLAAVAGALVAVSFTTVSATAYSPILSLTYFALIMINPGRLPWSGLTAGLGMVLVPSYLHGGNVTTVMQLLFGAFAVLTALLPSTAGEAPLALRRAIDATFGRLTLPRRAKARTGNETRPETTGTALADGRRARTSELVIEDLQVRYGGQVAVDGLSLQARTGEITGLIGPNGAGKTTTFNVCSGLVRPSRGRVRLDGRDISTKRPAQRARLGLGRTFQKMELLESLSVRENVAIGLESGLAGANPFRHFAVRRGDNALVAARTEEALRMCDLADLAEVPVTAISTGHRRLVELARCVVGDHSLLLLDEPSAGLDRAETRRFGEILKNLVAERGIGILLVEHDMSLVSDICSRVYVLDFGRELFVGTAADAMSSPIVQAAYLGSTAVHEGPTGVPNTPIDMVAS